MPRGAVIALGMGAELPNRLPDGSITASSEWIHDQTGEEGRSDETGRALDARMPDSKKTFHEWYMLPAWTPRHDECHSTLDGEWLQIAFARPVELVAVETQGKYGGGGWGVVHSYDVRTSDDGFAWELRATLEGCRTQNLERRRAELPSPVVARFVRIYPRQYWHRPSMRLELYGRSTPEPTAAVGGKVHPAADASYDDDEAIARALQDEENAATAEPEAEGGATETQQPSFAAEPYEIFVRDLSGATATLTVEADHTVAAVKELFRAALLESGAAPLAGLGLCARDGARLDPARTLRASGVGAKATLHAVVTDDDLAAEAAAEAKARAAERAARALRVTLGDGDFALGKDEACCLYTFCGLACCLTEPCKVNMTVHAPTAEQRRDAWLVFHFQLYLLWFEWAECIFCSLAGIMPGATCHWTWLLLQMPLYTWGMAKIRAAGNGAWDARGVKKFLALSAAFFGACVAVLVAGVALMGAHGFDRRGVARPAAFRGDYGAWCAAGAGSGDGEHRRLQVYRAALAGGMMASHDEAACDTCMAECCDAHDVESACDACWEGTAYDGPLFGIAARLTGKLDAPTGACFIAARPDDAAGWYIYLMVISSILLCVYVRLLVAAVRLHIAVARLGEPLQCGPAPPAPKQDHTIVDISKEISTVPSADARKSDGRFALGGGTAWVAEFAGGEFRPLTNAHCLHGRGVQVQSASTCVVPGWCRHGSTFKYSAKTDAWLETDHSKGRVTCTWTRVGY